MQHIKRYLPQALVCIVVSCLSVLAQAQGGPPLITNDPGTPGDGHWEINLAAVGSRTTDQWDVATPDVDVNYGWGESVQLSMHAPWNHRKSANAQWTSAPGPIELAVRWRFLDEDRHSVSVAIQPHWLSSGLAEAVRKDLAPKDHEFVLPIQAAKSFGKSILGVEIARHFAVRAPDAWQVGMFWANACSEAWQCLAEINLTQSQNAATETIVNVGARHPLNPHMMVMGTLGRQVSGELPRRSLVFYVGVQLLH